MKILGIKIDKVTKKEALEKVVNFLNSEEQYKIFTPNPEMLVDAQHDVYFADVLNEGDLNVCDGMGLQIFSGFRLHRIPGVDFMQDILEIAEKKNKSVYFLGSGDKEVLDNLKSFTEKKYPELKIVGTHPGIKIDQIRADGRYILAMDEKYGEAAKLLIELLLGK